MCALAEYFKWILKGRACKKIIQEIYNGLANETAALDCIAEAAKFGIKPSTCGRLVVSKG